MNISQVTVSVKKTLNDGHYGNEMAEVQFVAQVDPGEDPDMVVEALLIRGRVQVVNELRGSESISVRRALGPPKRVCSICTLPLADDEDYYHDACQAQQRAELEDELAAGRRMSRDPEDDDDR